MTSSIDKFIAGAFILIALYLVFTQDNVATVFNSLAGGFGRIFQTLQGKDTSNYQVN